MEKLDLLKIFLSFCMLGANIAINCMEDDTWKENDTQNVFVDYDQGEYRMQDLEAFINEFESDYRNTIIENEKDELGVPSVNYDDLAQSPVSQNIDAQILPNDSISPDILYDINMDIEQTDGILDDVVSQAANIVHDQIRTDKTGVENRTGKEGPAKKRRISEDKEERIYRCHSVGCDKAFKYSVQLNDHTKTEHGNGFKCEICGKSFTQNSNLRTHQKGEHGGGFKCDVCGKSYKSAGSLFNHKKRPHVDGLKCDFEGCFQLFKSVKALTKHKRSQHKKIQNHDEGFKCNICGRVFKYSSGLSTHKRGKHGKGFVCDVEGCGQRFESRPGLTDHKIGEHGDGFKCDIEDCGKIFKFRSSLNKHKKRKHAS